MPSLNKDMVLRNIVACWETCKPLGAAGMRKVEAGETGRGPVSRAQALVLVGGQLKGYGECLQAWW